MRCGAIASLLGPWSTDLVTTPSPSIQFINLISSRRQDVSEGLQSCTSQISVLEARIGGKPVVVIDTPGVDDTRPGMKEADFLVGVARRLKAM